MTDRDPPKRASSGSPRWSQRPAGSTWGDFGPDDEIGRLNLLTPEKVLQGIAEVREGLSFCLSLPLDLPGGSALNPFRFPTQLQPAGSPDHPMMNFRLNGMFAQATDLVCDDAVLLFLQYSTQWDSLAHIGQQFDAAGNGIAELVYYNGWRGGADIVDPAGAMGRPTGAHRLGIARMAEKAVQGRGVMVDLHAHFGNEHVFVGWKELEQVLKADDVVVERGDIVCLHTGFAALVVEMGGEPDAERLNCSCAVLDGRDKEFLDWIRESGIAALAADNFAVEALPSRRPAHEGLHSELPLHEYCLFRLGVPLGELWWLTDFARALRARKRSRFLLTAPPLRLPRAVGSPLTPVATI